MYDSNAKIELVFQWSPSIWNYGVMIYILFQNDVEVPIATLYEQLDFKDIWPDKEKLIKCALTK